MPLLTASAIAAAIPHKFIGLTVSQGLATLGFDLIGERAQQVDDSRSTTSIPTGKRSVEFDVQGIRQTCRQANTTGRCQ